MKSLNVVARSIPYMVCSTLNGNIVPLVVNNGSLNPNINLRKRRGDIVKKFEIKTFKPVKRIRVGRKCTRCENTVKGGCSGWHRVVDTWNFHELWCPSCSSKEGIPVPIWVEVF